MFDSLHINNWKKEIETNQKEKKKRIAEAAQEEVDKIEESLNKIELSDMEDTQSELEKEKEEEELNKMKYKYGGTSSTEMEIKEMLRQIKRSW